MCKVLKNTTVIIRSVGERTEQLCRKLILDQGVSEEDVFIVREVPFSAAMKKSFNLGIEQGKKWTICIDADVLLRPNSLQKLIDFAEIQDKNVCEIQGLVLDKFFSGPRQAGNRLYRTSLLSKLITCIPEEGVSIRPETHALQQMKRKGYSRVVVPYIVGIHDEEQYNYDIYRKAFVQAVKHLDRADLLIPHWKKNINKDQDFYVALKAFSDSIVNTDQLYINSDQKIYKQSFSQSGFDEKEELDINSFAPEDIEQRINKWSVDKKYYDYFPNSQGLDSNSKSIIRKVKHSVTKRGLVNTMLLSFSQLLNKFGTSLGKRVPK